MFYAARPEIALTLMMLGLLLTGAFRGRRAADFVMSASLFALGLAAFMVIFMTGTGRVEAFGGAFVTDGLARVMKALTLFSAAVVLIMSAQFMKREKIERFEYPVLVLLASLGMMAMISAGGLIPLYLGLELLALCLYVLAAMNRDSARSSEAGVKYYILGAISSGFFLYGASLLYGFGGTTNFQALTEAMRGHLHPGVTVGMVFVLAGMAFKVSAAPFHMWTPDVYEGAPAPVTAFFAAAPKVAAMAALIRLLFEGFPAATEQWRQVLVFMAVASMALGAFAGIAQNNIKRLLAYSAIGHMGFVLAGLAAGGGPGLRGAVIYMAIYLVMTLGVFACVIALRRDGRALEELEDFSGLARHNRGLAFALAMLMFSLAGAPPLAGFFAKYFVLLAAMKAGLYGLAAAGALSSVVAAVYYLKVVKVIYIDEPKEPVEAMPPELRLIIALSVIFILGFVAWPAPVIALAQAAIVPFL